MFPSSTYYPLLCTSSIYSFIYLLYLSMSSFFALSKLIILRLYNRDFFFTINASPLSCILSSYIKLFIGPPSYIKLFIECFIYIYLHLYLSKVALSKLTVISWPQLQFLLEKWSLFCRISLFSFLFKELSLASLVLLLFFSIFSEYSI